MSVTVGILAAACGGVPDVARDPEPMLQTGQLRYRLERHDLGYGASVDYAFHNRTGAAVSIGHCEGDVRPLLQVRRGESWVDAWHPLMRSCESDPIVVPADAVYADTLRIIGAPPGSNVSPTFVFEEVEGVYRLYWFQAALAPDLDPDLEAVERDWMASNAFVLAFR